MILNIDKLRESILEDYFSGRDSRYNRPLRDIIFDIHKKNSVLNSNAFWNLKWTKFW